MMVIRPAPGGASLKRLLMPHQRKLSFDDCRAVVEMNRYRRFLPAAAAVNGRAFKALQGEVLVFRYRGTRATVSASETAQGRRPVLSARRSIVGSLSLLRLRSSGP